ncbi:oxidoreductase [Kurthia sp. 3B1D]|uniref:Oxidoreductase n=1 Tax=Candidatus Kurthia intestinigallinarum TaxID=1562256 RepID=A0A433RTM5_9BACL|nr:oxidoreductase [Kurthia sp. 3B1D]
MMMTNIAFIGTGVMGQGMIKNFLKAGHTVHLYTRTKERALPLVELGATWYDTAQAAAEQGDVIFTVVGYPKDVEEVYFGDHGIFKAAQQGKIVVDMTTSQPALAKKIADAAQAFGMEALDAPVSGGDIGAQNGTLSIMVGGSKQAFEKVTPLFEVIGQNIVLQGEAGAGQHTKMCNQIAIATNMIGVCEALAYGKKAGLDMERVLQSIATGAAGSWSLSNLAPRMLQGDKEPGFYIRHMIKDMGIALDEASRMELKLPGLAMAKAMYDELSAKGYDQNGTQALIDYYEM